MFLKTLKLESNQRDNTYVDSFNADIDLLTSGDISILLTFFQIQWNRLFGLLKSVSIPDLCKETKQKISLSSI